MYTLPDLKAMSRNLLKTRRVWLLIPLGLGMACDKKSANPTTESLDEINRDNDGDGYHTPDDCDDRDPEVHPGEAFTCVWSELPSCTTGTNEVFTEDAMKPPEWGSDSYIVPPEGARNELSKSIRAALNGEAETALQSATYLVRT